jgi:hypothetical protein
VGQPAQIEKTGSADLTVHHGIGRAITALSNLAVANGGFVATSSQQSGASATGAVTLQVPEAAFDAVVGGLGSVGSVTQLSTRATDVTAQYVDLQARITALEASRQQYLTIMTKATSVGDILAVQAQLDQLQSELEQLQSQQQLLDSQTTYATLALSLFSPGTHRPPPPRPRPQGGLSAAFGAAWHGFLRGVEGLVRLSGPLLFVLLCLAVVAVAVRGGWRVVARRRSTVSTLKG